MKITCISLIIVFLLSLAGCKQYPAPEINVNGGTIKDLAGTSVRVRAYSPHIDIVLSRAEGDTRNFNIRIDNIDASSSLITPNALTVESKILSPTSLELKLNKGSGQISIAPPTEKLPTLRFAVIGDTQGRNTIFQSMIPLLNESNVDFLVHLGDMTPSGSSNEYKAFLDTIDSLTIPYFAVPGNHDIRGSGKDIFDDNFGVPNRYFDYRGWRLIFLDTSSLGLSTEDMAWLEDTLSQTSLPTFVFMHVPAKDPRGDDHSFLDQGQANALIDLLTDKTYPIKAVFSGHVHVFSETEINGVKFITSGGGGAGLYASPDQGGFHHFTVVEASSESIVATPVKAEKLETSGDLVLRGIETELVLSPEELEGLNTVEQTAKYQNLYGNYSGEGLYRGIPVKILVDLVGGMTEENVLVVYSSDGYSQEYSYRNVVPGDSWREHQGEMIVATSLNGETPPSWDDGYRIAFLPEDGVYDNDDCAKTSESGQGWDIYKSAGARWVKNVVRLEVK